MSVNHSLKAHFNFCLLSSYILLVVKGKHTSIHWQIKMKDYIISASIKIQCMDSFETFTHIYVYIHIYKSNKSTILQHV